MRIRFEQGIVWCNLSADKAWVEVKCVWNSLLLRSQEPNFLIKPSVDTVPSGVPRICLTFVGAAQLQSFQNLIDVALELRNFTSQSQWTRTILTKIEVQTFVSWMLQYVVSHAAILPRKHALFTTRRISSICNGNMFSLSCGFRNFRGLFKNHWIINTYISFSSSVFSACKGFITTCRIYIGFSKLFQIRMPLGLTVLAYLGNCQSFQVCSIWHGNICSANAFRRSIQVVKTIIAYCCAAFWQHFDLDVTECHLCTLNDGSLMKW